MSYTKPGITCRTHGSARTDQGTNCRNASPTAGIIGLATTYWAEAVSAERRAVDDIQILWARLFSPKKAADFAVARAKDAPAGLCARYSTAAVTAGFGVEESRVASLLGTAGASAKYVGLLNKRLALNINAAPNFAKAYGAQVLVPLGFSATAVLPADAKRDKIAVPEDYEPTIGDVIIFPANGLAHNTAGHMQIYAGDLAPDKKWVSDHHQKTILPNNTLALGWQKVGFVVYRFKAENLLCKPIAAL
jgi:hypothetical protein